MASAVVRGVSVGGPSHLCGLLRGAWPAVIKGPSHPSTGGRSGCRKLEFVYATCDDAFPWTLAVGRVGVTCVIS